MIKISPSILAADFGDFRGQTALVEKAGADMLHIDVMDGSFVPNITFGAGVVKTLRKNSNLIFDVHLMIDGPERYINDFADAGADIITVHAEASRHLHRLIQQIKEKGIKAGLAINPGTPVSAIKEMLPFIDMALVMSVNPGFTAQKFIPETLSKVKELFALTSGKMDIEIDGGINLDNLYEVTEAGANVIVAGAAIYYADDPAKAIENFRNTAFNR